MTVRSGQSCKTAIYDYELRFSAMYRENLSAMLLSLQFTAPFSVVPRVIAFLCIVTNCRFIRCSSERVTFRDGKPTVGFRPPGRDNAIVPPRPPDAACSAMIAATIALVVDSSARRASVGALGTCRSNVSPVSSEDGYQCTACVPALGGLTFPSVTAFQISSAGTSSSVQGTVNKGESHLTIDDGSS